MLDSEWFLLNELVRVYISRSSPFQPLEGCYCMGDLRVCALLYTELYLVIDNDMAGAGSVFCRAGIAACRKY